MKKFTVVDESFICEVCGKKVAKLGYTARDHCPYCLFSKHVDIYPGDRNNNCLGSLEPIGLKKHKDTYQIIYRCQKCKAIVNNVMATDDDMNLIIDLAKKAS